MKKMHNDLSVGRSIITALEQAVEYEKGGRGKRTRSDRLSVAPVPRYQGSRIKSIRNSFGLSQLTFAHVMGVSIKTVEAWESGRNEPQGPARRMLYLLESDDTLLDKYGLLTRA